MITKYIIGDVLVPRDNPKLKGDRLRVMGVDEKFYYGEYYCADKNIKWSIKKEHWSV